MDFVISADETNAPGALGYQISYGDGATDQNAVPEVCTSGPGQPASDTWQLSHAYSQPGTYAVTATVTANCTSDKATVTVSVTIS